jgi:hypothetical protein
VIRLRTKLAAVVAAGGGLLLAGCTSGTPGDLSPAGARALQPQVQHLREVAASGDYIRLRAAVAELKALVRQEQGLGHISAARAVAIDDAADVLLEEASPSPSPSPSPTTTSPTPTPTPTTTSPTPTPTPIVTTTAPIFSASAGTGNGDGGDNGNGQGSG